MSDIDSTPLLDRRLLLGGLTLAASASAVAAAGATSSLTLADLRKEADIACLYHCDFGETPRFQQMITNIANHYSAHGNNPLEVQLAIVAHGAGVKFFLETLEGTPWQNDAAAPAAFERVKAQASNGLKVHLCDITFQRLSLDRAKVRKAEFISFVPSGVAAVAALQSKGFAYLKVG